MLKITFSGNDIVIKKMDGHSLKFPLSDNKLFAVIKANIKRLGGECNFSVEKLSNRDIYLILNGYKLLINDLTLFEISSRMILLNNNITYPEYNFQEETSQE